MRALPAMAAVVLVSLLPAASGGSPPVQSEDSLNALPDASPLQSRPAAGDPQPPEPAPPSRPPMPVLGAILATIAGGGIVLWQRMRAHAA